MIDSCHFVSQSNYLNNSNKDCDWPILVCFIREQYTADATFTSLENKVCLKLQQNVWGNYGILYHKTNKEASTVFCSVVKHLGSSKALKKWGKTLNYVSCFPLHFLLYRFLHALQQNRAQSRFLYLLIESCSARTTKRRNKAIHRAQET